MFSLYIFNAGGRIAGETTGEEEEVCVSSDWTEGAYDISCGGILLRIWAEGTTPTFEQRMEPERARGVETEFGRTALSLGSGGGAK